MVELGCLFCWTVNIWEAGTVSDLLLYLSITGTQVLPNDFAQAITTFGLAQSIIGENSGRGQSVRGRL